MTTPLDILIKARELISDPKRWTQGVMARTAEGNPIGATTAHSYCFCIAGAINNVFHFDFGGARGANCELVVQAYGLIEKHIDQGIPTFNDTHTHAEVLELFDRAIETARSVPRRVV